MDFNLLHFHLVFIVSDSEVMFYFVCVCCLLFIAIAMILTFWKIPFCRTRKWIRQCDEAEYRFPNQNPAV